MMAGCKPYPDQYLFGRATPLAGAGVEVAFSSAIVEAVTGCSRY